MSTEIVEPVITIEDNILIISFDEIKNNSIYEIKIKKLKSKDGDNFTATHKYFSKVSPMYCTIEDIQSLIDTQDISKQTILLQIRAASQYCNYLSSESISEDNIPFEIRELTKYRAAKALLMNTFSYKASTDTEKGTLSDVSYTKSIDSKQYNNLIKLFEEEEKAWAELVSKTGTALIKTAQRGKKGYTPISYSINRNDK